MEKVTLTPLQMVARELMADPSRERTMTDLEAEESIRGALVHLRDRAVGDINGPLGIDHAREYELIARMTAYFGTMLIAGDEGIDSEKN